MKVFNFILVVFLLFWESSFCQENYFLEHGSISVYAVSCKSGAVLIDQNSSLSLTPASLLKIVTTYAALFLLDLDSRFETRLEHDGFIENHTLYGNLYLVGGGDPTLGSMRCNLSWKDQIDTWIRSLENLKIKKIKGKIICDSSRWKKELPIASWTFEDLANYYAATAAAFSFHENSYSLFFKSNREGEKTSLLFTDPPINFKFQNEVIAGKKESKDNAYIFGLDSSPLILGTIPAEQDQFEIKGSISDPSSFCAHLFAKELKKRAIHINQKMMLPSQRNLLQKSLSPTIKEIIYWTNQKSINLYAEHLLRKIGEEQKNDGSTLGGIEAIKAFLRKQNIDLEGFNMVDGSGLSRKNLITTKQLVEILIKIKRSPLFSTFLSSLPQKEKVRAKTGSMSMIKGYAGYKDDIAFAILINNCLCLEEMEKIMDNFFKDLNKIDLN